MPGAETRSRSASSEAVMPGLCLTCDEEADLSAGDAERVDLAAQLACEPQQNRAKPVRDRDGIVNHANH